MTGMIRVVVVDPCDETRRAFQALLGSLGAVWLVEVCASYGAAPGVVTEAAPELTIVALDANPEAALGLMATLARQHPATAVLPAARSRDADLILRAVRSGAREFLPLPAAPAELLEAINRLARPEGSEGSAARRGGQLIAVAGAAGGVGCTSLAVNLAAALASDAERPSVLADFDLYLGAVDACLDFVPDHTLLDLVRSVDRLDLTLLKRSLTRHASGLHVLPRPSALEDVLKVEPDALRRVVSLLRASFSSVVLDTSKGFQPADQVAFEEADVILLVVQQELVCLRNTARMLQAFRADEGLAERVRLVANRSGSKYFEIGSKKVEETLGMPIAFEIPNAPREFAEARTRGMTIEAVAGGTRIHRAFLDIARSLDPARAPKPPRKGLGRFAAMFF